MNPIPIFISFDYEHDLATKNRLVEEWGRPECPIRIQDHSLRAPVVGQLWKSRARAAIERSRAVIVLCGRNTHSAPGVNAEVQLAQALWRPIILLAAHHEGWSRPQGVPSDQPVHGLSWRTIHQVLSPLGDR